MCNLTIYNNKKQIDIIMFKMSNLAKNFFFAVSN